MNWKKSLIIGLLPVLILIVFLIILITQADYNDKMPVIKHEVKRNSFHIKNHINGLTSNNLLSTFPYNVFYDINAIKESILEIDTISNDNMLSQQIVSIALTDSLLAYSKNKYENYNPDSLILLMQWVGKFKGYSEIDKANEALYQSVDDYWMNIIANKLKDYCKNDYWLKYDFKFKYLSGQLEMNGYNTSIGFNDSEKVLNNIIENEYSYLIKRFFTRTSFIIKILFLFGILLTLYGYFCIYITHKKK